MATLYLFRGAPGSGKTTAAKLFATVNDTYFVEADRYMTNDAGDYQFDPRKLTECHRLCLQSAKYALANGWDCIVSNTFTRKWEMDPYLDFARECGHKVKVVRFTGQFPNVHGVPDDKVQQMRDRMEDVQGEVSFSY